MNNMKPVQCKNCKHFVRDIFYKSEGICNNDGRYTREHRVCNLLDTNEKKRDAKIKAVSSSVCTCEMPAKMKGKNQCWRYKKPFKEFLQTDHDQLVCPNCKLPFTKEELQIKEHCFNCGWEFAN